MWTILPAASFAALLLAFSARLGDGDMLKCWREAFISAAVTCGLVVVASSELLSVFRALTRDWLVAIWCVVAGVSVFCLARQLRRTQPGFSVRRADWSPYWWLPIAGIAAIVLTVGIIALATPPNDWDAMVYHMSRVAHWAQNRTIAFYPTHELRQLIFGPGAELAVLHGYVLSGTDRLANLVQWFSMVGSIIGTSLIAKHLGADSRGQILAAAVAATIPMGILQGSSTQTDYVVAFWMVCFAGSVLSGADARDGWLQRLTAGGSLGLALLAKATAYVFAVPFIVWLILRNLRPKPGRGLTSLAVVAAIAIAVNLGFYARNMELSGSPLGMKGRTGAVSLVNSVRTGPSLASNMARNLALHLGTPFAGANRISDRAIEGLHRLLGIGISDPRTTYWATSFSVGRPSLREDLAGNPLHVLLIALVIVLLPAVARFRARRILFVYVGVLLAQFLLFSLVLKWQPWGSRLQLAMFVLWSPLIGVVMSQVMNRKVGFAVACLCLLQALPYVLFNATRPLACTPGDVLAALRGRPEHSAHNIWNVGRTAQYFVNRPSRLDAYVVAAEFVKSANPAAVGLRMGGGDYEYPLWVLLRAPDGRLPRIENVGAGSAGGPSSYPLGPFHPDVVISTDTASGREFRFGRDAYVERWASGALRVLVKDADSDSAPDQ